MNEPRQLGDVGVRKVALLHAVLEDVLKQDVQVAHMICELREGAGGEDGGHGRSRRQVAAAEILHLGPDVEGEPVNGGSPAQPVNRGGPR